MAETTRRDEQENKEPTSENSSGWDAPQAPGSGLTATAEGIGKTPPSPNSITMPPPEKKNKG